MEAKEIQRIHTEVKKIKDREILFEIFKIIFDNNIERFEIDDNRIINESDNSIYLFFHNLTNNTYIKINEMIEKYKLSKKDDDSPIGNNIKFSSGDEYSDYSSKDIAILKRKKYEDNLKNKEKYQDFDVSVITDS